MKTPTKRLADRPAFPDVSGVDGPGLTLRQYLESHLTAALVQGEKQPIVGQTVDTAASLADELLRRWEGREYSRTNAREIARSQKPWGRSGQEGGAA